MHKTSPLLYRVLGILALGLDQAFMGSLWRALGETTWTNSADFVLVAGDLYDDPSVTDDVVHQGCLRLSRVPCPVFVLPGNHDPCGTPDAVYARRAFAVACPGNVRVLGTPEPVLAPAGAVLCRFPTPSSRSRWM